MHMIRQHDEELHDNVQRGARLSDVPSDTLLCDEIRRDELQPYFQYGVPAERTPT